MGAETPGREAEKATSRSDVEKCPPRQIRDFEHIAEALFGCCDAFFTQMLQEVAPVFPERESLAARNLSRLCLSNDHFGWSVRYGNGPACTQTPKNNEIFRGMAVTEFEYFTNNVDVFPISSPFALSGLIRPDSECK